jgi:hypothetical protein
MNELIIFLSVVSIFVYIMGVVICSDVYYGVMRSFFWPIIFAKSLWKTFWEVIKE